VRDHLRGEVDDFLAGAAPACRDRELCHPGGLKVLHASPRRSTWPAGRSAITWESLARVGNVSEASVLFVLDETMRRRRPRPGSPGRSSAWARFCAELVQPRMVTAPSLPRAARNGRPQRPFEIGLAQRAPRTQRGGIECDAALPFPEGAHLRS
jgi:hypothetical protein